MRDVTTDHINRSLEDSKEIEELLKSYLPYSDPVGEELKRLRLLEANKTNAIIVDGVIYRKGEYISLSSVI